MSKRDGRTGMNCYRCGWSARRDTAKCRHYGSVAFVWGDPPVRALEALANRDKAEQEEQIDRLRLGRIVLGVEGCTAIRRGSPIRAGSRGGRVTPRGHGHRI